MTQSGERDLSRIGGIDYLLMTVGSCLAAFSGGMAIQEPSVILFSVVAIALGALTSFGVRALYLGSEHIKLDGYFYSAAIIAAFAFGAPLQNLMPNEGYPPDVLAAGWLTWMLILGSFFTWQDNTLVFQAIPSVALLGLVGVYDTFRDIRYAFFGFLLCLALLFARAHRRAMLRQAAESGYFTRGLAPGTPSPSVETTPGLAKIMEEGPWKWTAGPGWALASAFAVVLISLLGTPVIQQSVQGVTGFVKVPVPKSLAPKTPQAPGLASANSGSVQIGRGPNQLSREPVCEAEMAHPYYLRTAWYDQYSNGYWACTLSLPASGAMAGQVQVADLAVMKDPVRIPFAIRLREQLQYLPIPGSGLYGWTDSYQPGIQSPSGSWVISQSKPGEQFRGNALVPSGGEPVEAVHDLPSIYSRTIATDSIPRDVYELAQETAKSGHTDYERAQLIRQKIAETIVYNLDAAKTPDGVDPVSYVMFHQREAYCDLYASTMTLMARSVGIPARFCLGYRPDETERDGNGVYVVLESDLHAWSELYFKDYGWVVFDATDGANEVPGSERGTANVEGPFLERAWVKTTLNVAIAILAIAAIFAGFRAQIVRRRAITPRMELGWVYDSFAKVLERASGKRRGTSQTPDEFFTLVAGSLGAEAGAARALNDSFVRALYSSAGFTEADVANLRAEVRNLSKMLRKSSQAR